MNKLRIMPLGGLEQIGANCTLIGFNDVWIMIDLGISFHNKLGIEILVPDISFALNLKDKLRAIFVTHAHEDHIGAIYYFWNKLQSPIYLSEFSASVLKQKLKSNKISFSKSQVITTNTKTPVILENFIVEFVSLSHSVVGTCGLFIQTPGGNIFHTGDWKIDNNPLIGDKIDSKRLQEIGKLGIDCLLCDSTNVLLPEEVGSEYDVKETLDKLISQNNNKRITITCFASNIARIETIFSLAKKYNRKIAIIGRSIYGMLQAVTDTKYMTKEFKNNMDLVINDEQAQSLPKDKVLMICTGSQGESRSALFRLARGENKQINLGKQDVVLFSSKVIPGNELYIRDMQNLLVQNGVEIITTETEKLLHVSGHPNKFNLKQMYSWLNPKSLIPVHGDPVMLHAHKQFAEECGIKNTIVISSGDIVTLEKESGSLKKIDHIDIEYNAIDSKQIIPLNHVILRERQILSVFGFVGISFAIINNNDILDRINISIHGIYVSSVIFRKICKDINKIFKNLIVKFNDDNKIKSEGKILVKQLIFRSFEKKPIVDIYIHRI